MIVANRNNHLQKKWNSSVFQKLTPCNSVQNIKLKKLVRERFFLPSPYLALSFPQFDKPKFLRRDNEILVPLFLSITVPEDGTNYALWFETLDLKKRISFFCLSQ